MALVKQAFISLGIVITLSTLLANPTEGYRVGREGDSWLKANPEVRNAYAIGYTLGFGDGLYAGCKESAKDAKNVLDHDPFEKCLKENLVVSDTSQLAQSVTNFYMKYPGDRYLYITDVMEAVGRGMTLEHIHKNAGPCGVRTDEGLCR